MSFSTPIGFFIFNRPDLTQIVFETIAKVKPRRLFVVADGPRNSVEADKCAQSRAVLDGVNWDCEVLTHFSDTNLGCGHRIASGIEWIFSQVEEAIFLEDDCLPVLSFFPYCEALLKRYRDDNRIMCINGTNFQSGQSRTTYSYHFSKYCSSWGWASWRRAWKHYDFELKTWPEFKLKGMMEMVCQDPYEVKFWEKKFDSLFENPTIINTWDHQWNYACWSQNGLAIEPCVNLVSNLGFGHADATHTTGQNSLQERIGPPQQMGEMTHPPFVVRHSMADTYIFDYVIGGKKMKQQDAWFSKLRRYVSAIRRKTKALGFSQ